MAPAPPAAFALGQQGHKHSPATHSNKSHTNTHIMSIYTSTHARTHTPHHANPPCSHGKDSQLSPFMPFARQSWTEVFTHLQSMQQDELHRADAALPPADARRGARQARRHPQPRLCNCITQAGPIQSAPLPSTATHDGPIFRPVSPTTRHGRTVDEHE